MDCMTTTEDLVAETKVFQDNLLLDIIKEVCSQTETTISSKLKGKVNRLIADCDLTHYTGLHKLTTAYDNTSTLLGLMNKTTTELTFDEQAELNQAIIDKINTKVPKITSELEKLTDLSSNGKKSRKEQIKELHNSLDEKLKMLEEQESEKVELMMEWLNHRLQDVVSFEGKSTEVLTLKTKILELKSKILHLNILQNIFTETNNSIKAYDEIHKDLKDNIKEAEERIKKYREIIDSDLA